MSKMTFEEAKRDAKRFALQWGGTWVVVRSPEGGYGRGKKWCVPGDVVLEVTDPMPPGYLENLWRQFEVIRKTARRGY